MQFNAAIFKLERDLVCRLLAHFAQKKKSEKKVVHSRRERFFCFVLLNKCQAESMQPHCFTAIRGLASQAR